MEDASVLVSDELLVAAGRDLDELDRRRRRATLFERLFDRPSEPVMVDRFVVQEPIGAGAMGRVYLAHDPRLDREVALKLVRAVPGNPEAEARRRRRLLEEARALARLDHPNVVAVHEAGELDDEVFIAMQYVRGCNLRQWLAQQPRGWSEALAVLLAAGAGLAAAHEAGLVHRDFKPDNVLIADDGRVRVGDFGLARESRSTTDAGEDEGPSPRDAGAMTRTGSVLGTPAYMAPEQRRGEVINAAADQYAFCVTLYEALHGARPDEGPDASPGRVPRWIDAAIARGLSEAPHDRFDDMRALLQALSRDPGRRRRRWLATAAVAAAGSAAVMLLWPETRDDPCRVEPERIDASVDDQRLARVQEALVAGQPAFAASSAASVERALRGYAEHWREGRRDACVATWVRHEQSEARLDQRMACLDDRAAAVEALVSLLSDPATADPHRALQAVEALPPVSECASLEGAAARAVHESPAARALRQRLVAARLEGELGHHRAALDQGLALEQEAKPLQEPALLAAILHLCAEQQVELREPEEAEALLERSLHEAIAAGDDLQAAVTLATLVHLVGYLQSRGEEGERWLGQARAVLRKLGEAPRIEAQLLNEEGNLHHRAGRLRPAQRAFEAALRRTIEATGPEHLHVGGVLNNLGNIAHALGEDEDALRYFDRAIALWTSRLGAEHPLLGMAALNRGGALRGLGRADEAAEAYAQAQRIYEHAFGPEHVDVARALGSRGNLALDDGRFGEAREHYSRSLVIIEASLGPEHPLVATSAANLGHTYRGEGDCDAALPHYERALEIRRARYGDDNPKIADTHDAIVRCLVELGRADEARPLAQRSDAIRVESYGAEHPRRADSRLGLGLVAEAQLRPQDARAHLEAGLALVDDAHDPAGIGAELRFALARSLATDDPDRARALARRARRDLQAQGPGARTLLDRVDAWLAAHP